MLESQFQKILIADLYDLFPGCLVLKNDSGYLQGIPDLLILHNDRWAALECKASEKSRTQPNQLYYIEKLSEMSFAKVIYPENVEEVLYELQQAFQS